MDTRRWFPKFLVRRRDGEGRNGGKHYRCEYFVLDLKHDPAVPAALAAYADAVRVTRPLLAIDIDKKLAALEASPTRAARKA